MRTLGETLGDLIHKLGIESKLNEYEAVLRWEEVVGEHVARVATPVKIVKGVLIVNVKASTWRNELTLRKREIMQKLNTALAADIVKDIKFQ